MGKDVTTFGDTEVEKPKFNYYKNLILLKNVDIDNTQVSSMVSHSKKTCKYFIDYIDDGRIKPLHIMLTKKRAYIKSYEGKTK